MARFLFVFLGFFLAAWPAAAQRGERPGEPTLRDLPLDLNPRKPYSGRVPGAAPGDGQASEKQGKNQEKAPPPVTLESLYDRLAAAKDRQEASVIVKQIERRWARSGSDTTDLLLSRASIAINSKQNDTALELFDHIILLKPDWAEVYHRRATLFFQMNDYDSAMRDLQMVLQREPRHFAAMSGLGLVLQQMDNKKAALAAYKRALELNPNMENLKSIVERLTPEVEGVKL